MDQFNIKAISKAIAAALAGIIITWLARNGIVIDSPAVEGIVEYLVAALLSFIVVYLAPRNQDGPRL